MFTKNNNERRDSWEVRHRSIKMMMGIKDILGVKELEVESVREEWKSFQLAVVKECSSKNL